MASKDWATARPCRDGDEHWSPSWANLLVGDVVRVEPARPDDAFDEFTVLGFEPNGVVKASSRTSDMTRLNPCFLQRKKTRST